MQKPLVVILLGPPGSGKGTQAELLAEKLNLYYFETSKIIEERVMEAGEDEFVEIDGEKYSLVHERELWKSGVLCTPTVISYWVREEIKELANIGKNLVIAGSPRTLPEGKDVMPFLEELYGKENIKVINIKLNAEASIQRNTNRRLCQDCRHPIPFIIQTANWTNCPKCNGPLAIRTGLDSEESIRTRLVEYKNRTEPLLNYFLERGLDVQAVDGEQDIEKVFEDILKSI